MPAAAVVVNVCCYESGVAVASPKLLLRVVTGAAAAAVVVLVNVCCSESGVAAASPKLLLVRSVIEHQWGILIECQCD